MHMTTELFKQLQRSTVFVFSCSKFEILTVATVLMGSMSHLTNFFDVLNICLDLAITNLQNAILPKSCML